MMKRLTKWVDPAPKIDSFPYGDSASQYTTKDKKAAINKLGKLEDVECMIGTDIATIFRALRCGIYIVCDDGIVRRFRVMIMYEDALKDYGFVPIVEHDNEQFSFPLFVHLEHEGLLWGLTKEELDEGK